MEPLRLRFGVVTAGAAPAYWQVRCVRALTERGAELALWLQAPPPAEPPGGARLFAAWWRRALRRCRALRPEPPGPGWAARPLQGAAPSALADLGLDLVIDLGGAGDPGALAAAARLGVLALWHGPAAGDGGPLARLDPPARSHEPLRLAVVRFRQGRAGLVIEGSFRARRNALRNLDRALLVATDCLVAACARLARAGEAPDLPDHPWPVRPRTVLADPAMARFLALQARELAGALGDKMQLETWNIGVVRRPPRELLGETPLRGIEWLPAPPLHRFYADPMALPGADGAMLAEEFDHVTGRGRICCLAAPGWRCSYPAGLDTGLHMSYPQLVEHGSEILCLPESFETGGVPLFRATRFPDRWERIATLLPGFPAVDATLFRHDGAWWLLCGREGETSDSELHVWFADAPTGPFRPHPLNPVKLDVRSSRPAGPPFLVDGVLYRPAQDGARTYGGALAINRIVTLERERFLEEVAWRIEPDRNGPYPDGLHTFCASGAATLVDGKRVRFHPAAPLLRAWGRRAHGRRLRRLAPGPRAAG
ncbi:MAG: hypothetical protein U1E53_04950 [Dongiaceae bacterium]